jgi:hypothetical protein
MFWRKMLPSSSGEKSSLNCGTKVALLQIRRIRTGAIGKPI